MNRRHFTSSLLLPVLGPLPVVAAGGKPRAARPKLVRNSTPLIQDAFDTAPLSEKWVSAGERTKCEVEFREGSAVLAQAGDGQGFLYQKFTAPVENAIIDVLVKPFACKWVSFGFLVADDSRPFKRLLAVVLNELGGCSLHDVEERKVIKAMRTKLKNDEWRRLTVEAKGDTVLVQIDGEEVLKEKIPLIAPAKTGIAITLYGGKAMIDDMVVSAETAK